MAKKKFFKEIHDGVLYEAAESFDVEISITNIGIKWRQFVDLCALMFLLATCIIKVAVNLNLND